MIERWRKQSMDGKEPPFRYVAAATSMKRSVDASVWAGVGSVLAFYVVLGLILVEIFKPEWIHHLLRVITEAP